MKKEKDILFLCQFFYPEYISSAQLPLDTAERLTQAGYKVGVLCGYPREYTDKKKIKLEEIYNKIFIKRVKYLQFDRKSLIGRVINYVSFMLVMLFNIFRARKYRCIIVYSNPPILPLIAVLAKKIWGISLVFVSYDVYPEIGIQAKAIRKNGITYKIFQCINRVVFKNADKIIALSKDMETFLCNARNIRKEKVDVIPNWCEDIGTIRVEKARENSLFENIPPNAFVISYLGNMGTCQEMSTLMNCIRKLKKEQDIHFVFAGHGNKMEKIKEIVQKEQLKQVHIFGYLKGKDYEDVLSISNVFVVTLLKDLKGLCSPSKACSYFMAGKPVLGVLDSEIELAVDIEEKKCGFIIQHGKPQVMVDKIILLKKEKTLYRNMAINTRRLYEEKYEKKICIENYVKVFEKLMSESKG